MNDHPSPAWNRQDLLCLAILFLGVSLFYSRGIAPGQAYLAVDLAGNNLPWLSGQPQRLQNWLISDPIYQTYPFLSYAVETVRGGDWPLWNPRILIGHPALADPLAQTFYPIFLLFGLLFGVARGLTLGLWLHVLLAAGLSYGLMRSLGCRRPAAILGAFGYALGGYMVTWFETPFWISTLSWLPGVLWAFEEAVQRRSLIAAGLGALAMGAALLGGQVAFGVEFALFLGLYAMGRSVELALRRDGRYRWPLLVAPSIVVPAAFLSAIQTVPFVELLDLSHRRDYPWSPDPLPIHQLITLIVPNFYGNPATTGSYWGAINFSEATAYVGLPMLLLALVAPFSSRRFLARFLALVMAATLYLAVGGPGADALASIPPLRYASLHRMLFLIPLEASLLAGMALSEPKTSTTVAGVLAALLASAIGVALQQNWGEAATHWPELQSPVIQAVSLLTATIGLLLLRSRSRRTQFPAEAALAALAFADLFLFGQGYNPSGPIDDLMPPTPALRYLQQVAPQRILSYQRTDQLLLGPNVASLYGLAEGGGYSSLIPARFHRLAREGDPKQGITGIGFWLNQNGNIVFYYDPSSHLLDLLQVSHVVSPLPLKGMAEVYSGEVNVYRREVPPRAYVVYGAEMIPEESKARKRLLEDSFDLRKLAVVDAPMGLPAQTDLPATSAQIVEYRPCSVALKAWAAQKGLLVLGDQYYPGWEALVDGRPATVQRVNEVWRGVLLPPGEHEVLLRFRPISLQLGGLLGLVGLAMVAALAAIDRRRPPE